jgi:hypothetical protein
MGENVNGDIKEMQYECFGLYSLDSETVAASGCCEHGNEPSTSSKSGEFFE